MRKKSFIIILLILTVTFLFCKKLDHKANFKNKEPRREVSKSKKDEAGNKKRKIDLKFRIIMDCWAYPFLFENNLNYFGFSFNGSIMAGVKFRKFTFGLEVSENYFSLKNYTSPTARSSPWNVLRFTANGYFEPTSWFELKWGAGGAWYNAAYTVDGGIIGVRSGGISFVLTAAFRPWKYIRLDLINNFDLFFLENNEFLPYYTGGVRLNFNPGVKFINFYIETSGMLYIYEYDPYYIDSPDITSGMFLWGTGFSFDLCTGNKKKINKLKKDKNKSNDFRNKKRNNLKEERFAEIENKRKAREDARKEQEKKSRLIQEEREKQNAKKEEERLAKLEVRRKQAQGEKEKKNNKLKEIEEALEVSIEELMNAKDGDVVLFSDIIFFPDSDKIKKESFDILDKIAKALIQRKEIHVEVQGHTNFIGKPEAELSLSRKRAIMVGSYLIKKGVKKDRIATFGFGGYYSKGKDVIEANRRVGIEIIIDLKKEVKKVDAFSKISQAKKEDLISFPGIYFEKVSDKILPRSLVDLDKIAVILNEKQDVLIAISGYAIPTGDPYADLELTTKRAKVIKNYLTENGIDESRIKILATGLMFSEENEDPCIEIKIL